MSASPPTSADARAIAKAIDNLARAIGRSAPELVAAFAKFAAATEQARIANLLTAAAFQGRNENGDAIIPGAETSVRLFREAELLLSPLVPRPQPANPANPEGDTE